MEDSIKEKDQLKKEKDEIILVMWNDFIGIETFDDFKKVRKNGLGFIYSNITSQRTSPHQSPTYEQDDQSMEGENVEIIDTTNRNVDTLNSTSFELPIVDNLGG